MNRRIILVLSIALLIAIAIGLFFLFRRNGTDNPTLPTSNLLPTSLPGQSGFGVNTSIIGGATTTPGSNIKVQPRLRHLTLLPTAGDIPLSKQIEVIENRIKTTKNVHIVRYMDRATGHIYEINIDEPEAHKIANTTIPKVYEATFAPGGDTIIARFLSEDEEILTYAIVLEDKKVVISTSTKPTVANEKLLNEQKLKDVTGTYLPTGIDQISLSPSGERLLALTNVNGNGVFSLSGPTGKNPRTVLTHPFHEWLTSLSNESTAVITTKPAGSVNGYGYTLNLTNGSLQKIVGGIAGLTLLPNSALTYYLGGATPGSTINLFSVTPQNPEPNVLPLSTLPEKCVWARKSANIAYCAVPRFILPATYPDDWYKGRIFFTDELWKLNLATGETTFVSDLPVESGQAIDAINLILSSDDEYLTFINKIDLTLWGIDLTVQ